MSERERDPLPSWAQWCDRAAALDLRNRSGELTGPCPSCGGTDRFHVRRRGADALVGCRGCIDGGGDGFVAVLRTAFPERFEKGPKSAHKARSAPRAHDRTGRSSKLPPGAALTGESAPGATDTAASERAALAGALWRASGPVDDSPGREYLARRFACPPAGIGPELPVTIRWLAAGGEPRWYWPKVDGAAGALVFAWRRIGGGLATLSLMAVSEAGERVLWDGRAKTWILSGTSRDGATFGARPGGDADPAHVAEGEVSALALALWCGPGAIYAAGGTAGMRRGTIPGRGPVVIHADGDGAGRQSAERARHAIAASGRECRIEWYAARTDPADSLADWIGERAAIREFESGEPRAEAARGAWMDLLRRLPA